MRPTLYVRSLAGAVVITAQMAVMMAAVHAVAAAAAAEQKQKKDNQPDAGTVVVKSHVCHLTCSSLSYDMPERPPVYLVRRLRGKENEKGKNYHV